MEVLLLAMIWLLTGYLSNLVWIVYSKGRPRTINEVDILFVVMGFGTLVCLIIEIIFGMALGDNKKIED